MIKYAFGMLLIMLCFNSKGQYSYIGHYKDKHLSISELSSYWLKGLKPIAGNIEIILNKDSSFQYITCANIITGNWKVIGNEMRLNCSGNKFRIDSLNTNLQNNEDVHKFVIIYKIVDHTLQFKTNKNFLYILRKEGE